MREPTFRFHILAIVVVTASASCIGTHENSELDTEIGEMEAAVLRSVGSSHAQVLDIEREHIVADIWHHSLTIERGEGPNARIRLHRVVRERSPWRVRKTASGAMLLHGDFSSFSTNYCSIAHLTHNQLTVWAVYLAQQGVDVWGIDRRWALTATDGDISDFGEQGLAQQLDDTEIGLAIARGIRAVTGSGFDKLHLVGFSRGGVIAYTYVSSEQSRPWWRRHVRGLVPLDVWATPGPDDEFARTFLCDSAAFEYQQVADGIIDSGNGFVIATGQLALSDPDGASPFIPGFTNLQTMLSFAGQTYQVFAPSEFYHLAAPFLEAGFATGLRESSEETISRWFANASPHQSMLAAADTDAAQCADGTETIEIDLNAIEVPLFYLGAAGGYGDGGIYSTTQVSSTDVSTLVIQRFDTDEVDEDFGHADLLFADDAPTLAWQPLAEWLRDH